MPVTYEPFQQPTKILVTGASGFLGSHLMHRLPVAATLGLYHTHKPEPDGCRYQSIDLCDEKSVEAVLRGFAPEGVLHAAARSDIDWCEANRGAARKINTDAPAFLARKCREIGCRFLFVSTDMVFDGGSRFYAEADAAAPILHYGRTKLEAEQAVLQENPDAVVARVALIYGLPVAAGRGRSFLTWLLERLAAGEPAPLFYDQFRTPVEVGELAAALIALLRTDFAGIIHVAGSERINRVAFGELVCKTANLPADLLQPLSMREVTHLTPRPRDLSLRTDRLAAVLGNKLSGCAAGVKTALAGHE